MASDAECAKWEQLAADAAEEAAKHLPTPATLAVIRHALDGARLRLGGEDTGKHCIPFHPHHWRFGNVSLPVTSLQRGYVCRQDDFDVAKLPQTPETNWQLFCASFVFGYGQSGLGPFRFRRLTRRTAQPKLSAVIADARHLLRDCGPLSAYDYLRGDTTRIVPHWGPAFFTKLLYFADASGTALILDNQLARIVHRLSGMDHLVKRYGRSECWTTWRYGVYLAWMHRAADMMEVRPDFLEYALFTEARPRPRR